MWPAKKASAISTSCDGKGSGGCWESTVNGCCLRLFQLGNEQGSRRSSGSTAACLSTPNPTAPATPDWVVKHTRLQRPAAGHVAFQDVSQPIEHLPSVSLILVIPLPQLSILMQNKMWVGQQVVQAGAGGWRWLEDAHGAEQAGDCRTVSHSMQAVRNSSAN